MVLHFNFHQRLRSSASRGNIHPKTQLTVSRLVHGRIRAALRRFPQTSSTLAALPLISFAFLLSIMVPPPNIGAQEVNIDQTAPRSLKQLSLEQLGNLEVTTVSKEPGEIQRTAAAIYVLTQEDIRRSGATSIPEVLRLVPGVEVAQIDSSTWAVGIRGFGNSFSKSVLVLIDGRNVYTPLFAGVDWKLQNVMIEDVERIEVIRGPGGTIWGTNAVNGVINIITKNSKDTQGTLVSVDGGNVDQGTGEFRQGGKFGRNINYRVYGMAFGRGPQFHSDHDNFDDWQLGKGGFRMDWDNRGTDSFTVQGDLYKGGVGQRENVAFYSPPASINLDGTEHVSGGNILGRWSRKLDEASDFQLQAYYDRTYRLGPQLGETRNTFDIDFLHQWKVLPRQDIIWGLGARWSASDFIQTVATVDFLPHHQSDNIYSAFVQDEIAIVRDKLSATIGGNLGLESQPGSGSCFYFILPGAEAVKPRNVQEGGGEIRNHEFARILVIEDDRAAAQLLQSHLTSAAY